MKNSIDTIGNQTHDFPACSTVLQPTAPPNESGVKSNTFLFLTLETLGIQHLHSIKFLTWIICSGGLQLAHTSFSETHFN
jgi:hypothetical protein